MKDLEKMTVTEKSLLLARAMKCGVDTAFIKDNWYDVYLTMPAGDNYYIGRAVKHPHDLSLDAVIPDFYAPQHMALARQVMVWARNNNVSLRLDIETEIALARSFTFYPKGQQASLDAVLRRVLDAGLIKV